METKICSKCEEELKLNEDNFAKRKDAKCGFRNECKACIKKYNREYKKNNAEAFKVSANKWTSKNKDKILKKRIEDKDKIAKRAKKYNNKDAKYSTYKDKLFANDVRECKEDILEVRCKHCKEWFSPTNIQVQNRIKSINGETKENHFYCGQKCKDNCEVFGKRAETLIKQDELNAGIYTIHKHEGFYTDGELQVWSGQVIENASNTCEICGQIDDSQAHHILPKSEYPEQALDPLNGVCLCEKCHYDKGHSQNGCKTGQLRKCEVKT